MGWSMTQVSGLAQTLFKARIRWIDGISSARWAMEQAVYQVREQSRASSGLDTATEMRLREPLYAQCLGFDTPRIRRAPAPSRAGWVGAAQVGPFAPEEAGDSSDEDGRGGPGQLRLQKRVARDPAFADLLGAAERMEHCIRCGESPCWSNQGDVKVSGGLCRQCASGPGSHAVTTHCSNCGEAQAQHQWAMIAVSD